METYLKAKDLVPNPLFFEQRQKALRGLASAEIDAPIAGLIAKFAQLPYCFTLQCCYGHFLHDEQPDPHNLDPLPEGAPDTPMEYRIAYLALCVQDSPPGRALLQELSELWRLAPRYIQYGCAEWFWERQVNSYIVQVEPERYHDRDRCIIPRREAQQIDLVRERFFTALGEMMAQRNTFVE